MPPQATPRYFKYLFIRSAMLNLHHAAEVQTVNFEPDLCPRREEQFPAESRVCRQKNIVSSFNLI